MSLKYSISQGFFFMDCHLKISIVQANEDRVMFNFTFHSPDDLFPDQTETLDIATIDTITITELLKKVKLQSFGLTRKGAVAMNQELLKQFYDTIHKENNED